MPLLPLLFTIFLDSLGFGLVFPIFSPLIMHETSGFLSPETSLATRGFIFGALVSCFCLGQFFASPILGALSDRKGRKKILCATLLIAFFTYMLAGVGILFHSVIILFIARLLGGAAAGNFAIAQSVVADFSEGESKGKNFGLIGMAWGVGFIIGPFLGGKLSDPTFLKWCSLDTPFWVAAVLSLVNLAVLMPKLKESVRVINETKLSPWSGFYYLKKAFTLPKLRTLFLVMFIFSLGWGFFTEFSPIFLIRSLDFSGSRIGDFYACVGIWVALCQGLLIRPFIKRFRPHHLLLSALFCLGIVLPFMLLVGKGSQVFIVLPFLAFFESLIFPSASTIVSDLSSKEEQGEMLGINNSIQWAAIGLCPMFSGAIVAVYPHLPITVAAFCMFLAFGVCFWSLKKKRTVMQNLES